MKPYKEEEIRSDLLFPVDIFIKENKEADVSADPHWHDCYEILYMLEGAADQQINDNYFKACKNDLIILSQGDIHSTFCPERDDTRILVIKFLPELIYSNYFRLFESKYIVPFLSGKSSKIYHIADTYRNSQTIYNIMIGLHEEFSGKETGYEICIKGFIYQLIANLVRGGVINMPDYDINKKDMSKLDTLLKYIEKHYMERINLEDASRMLNFSYSYFSRYFKKITGKTFKEYVDFVRICEAEKLIITGNFNISQTAYEVGFANVSGFSRLFKRVRGYLPGDIKRS